MRNYENLSDFEFEGLVGDLLEAELGFRFERFTRGADQGIDLRHIRRNRRPDVVQVKHYKGSSWSDLRRAAEREIVGLRDLDPQPVSYRFVTSQGLTPRRKRSLAETLAPYVTRDDYVMGREDVDKPVEFASRHRALGNVTDYVWFSAKRLWVSSANFTYASRRSLEFGYWTENSELLDGVERFLVNLIGASEDLDAHADAPDPDLLSIQFDHNGLTP